MSNTTYISARGNTITINRPELTAEERAKRMEVIKQATIQLIVAAEKNRRRHTI